MAQAGLHIPADEGSTVRIYESVLVDIGDEQSIEQSLSTFSSHMVNIVSFMDKVTDRSLVLFDELGVGTDPVEGAALAVSIIEEIRKRGALCAATTHYAELKVYALNTPGVINANCEFDVETLKPTYRLILGTPGKSNAFAISAKLGIPENIINRALKHIEADKQDFESVIGRLEEERVKEQKMKAELERMKAEFEAYRIDAEAKIEKSLSNAKAIEEKAEEKARATIEGARASSEYIFNELDKLRKQRESANLGEELAKTRADVRKFMKDYESQNTTKPDTNENYVLPRPLRVGDDVLLVNIDKTGTVTEISGNNVVVQTGLIKTKTKLSNLRLVDTPVVITAEKKKQTARSYISAIDRSCSSEIDLRGKTGDEAWPLVDRYLDKASMAGLNSVRLVHGKGTGALKNYLWGMLRNDSRVKSYRIGVHGEGDGGVTVVTLK
jgi:DNA mismatch repair protein MutS2